MANEKEERKQLDFLETVQLFVETMNERFIDCDFANKSIVLFAIDCDCGSKDDVATLTTANGQYDNIIFSLYYAITKDERYLEVMQEAIEMYRQKCNQENLGLN